MIHKFEVQVQEFEVQDVVDAYQAFEEFDRMNSGIVPTAKDFEIATHVMGQIMVQAHRKGVNFTFKPEEV